MKTQKQKLEEAKEKLRYYSDFLVSTFDEDSVLFTRFFLKKLQRTVDLYYFENPDKWTRMRNEEKNNLNEDAQD